MSVEDALRQLLVEAEDQLDFAREHGQEKATAMLFAARTKEIVLKGLGKKDDSNQQSLRRRIVSRQSADDNDHAA